MVRSVTFSSPDFVNSPDLSSSFVIFAVFWDILRTSRRPKLIPPLAGKVLKRDVSTI